MLTVIMNFVMYGMIFLSLYLFDYALGHGFFKVSRKLMCKVACFVKKIQKEEALKTDQLTGTDNPINLPIVLMEIIVLTLTAALLRKYKQIRARDRFDELMQESKEALRQTNEFLEKWRVRRIMHQVKNEGSYLDEEPQEIKPFKLEIPILHMAIIDTRGTTRSQPERGDAGDTINITDSTLLSVTSLIDEDTDDTFTFMEPMAEKSIDDIKNVEFRNRYLWDVMEEDSNNLDD